MTYFDVINQAIELCVSLDETSGLYYLEPPYRMLLREGGLLDQNVIEAEELYELLKLEVEKLNTKNNRINAVAEWIHRLLTEEVDPAVLQEENELMKNMMEYMQKKEELKDKEKDLNAKEQSIEVKERVGNIIPFDINFSKRKD